MKNRLETLTRNGSRGVTSLYPLKIRLIRVASKVSGRQGEAVELTHSGEHTRSTSLLDNKSPHIGPRGKPVSRFNQISVSMRRKELQLLLDSNSPSTALSRCDAKTLEMGVHRGHAHTEISWLLTDCDALPYAPYPNLITFSYAFPTK